MTSTTSTARGGIFRRFALRSLTQNRTRTFVSIVGIALACALITAIFTSVTTLISGLRNVEIARNGTWQVNLQNVSEASMADLAADDRVTDLYEFDYYGCALMPEGYHGGDGRYLSLAAWPTSEATDGLVLEQNISSGRAPAAAGEIVLPTYLKGETEARDWYVGDNDATPTGRDADVPRVSWDGALDKGTVVNLALGDRVWEDKEAGRERPCLYSESLYTEVDEATGQEHLIEWLDHVGDVQSFTVVGFYDPNSLNTAGFLGFTAPADTSDLAVHARDAYLSTNLTTRADLENFVSDYTGLEHGFTVGGGDPTLVTWGSDTIAWTHDNLLSYQGITDNRAIWQTFYMLAAILSGVVMVASVSLIYNSFAISVSERTRSYGLLASLGASKRQLRRTVYTEALILAVIGIPMGLLLGLAGTAVVFNVAGDGLAVLIDSSLAADMGPEFLALDVRPEILGVSALLALATVLISAAVPARRASRVSAVDAIRQSRDVALTRREQRHMSRGSRSSAQNAPARHAHRPNLDALRMRLFGLPGVLARRNLTRASSKSRVAVASLAVSVALIITSGALSHYVGMIASAADNEGGDIEVYAGRNPAEGETTADLVEAIDTAYNELGSVDGVTSRGYAGIIPVYFKADPGVLDEEELTREAISEYDTMPEQLVGAGGSTYGSMNLTFVDDATWKTILSDNNLDEAEYCDPDHPIAIGQNNTPWNDGETYSERSLFASTGTVTIFRRFTTVAGHTLRGLTEGVYGVEAAYDCFDNTAQSSSVNDSTTLPLADAVSDAYELRIGAIAEQLPEVLKSFGSIWTTAILPFSALPTLAASSEGTGLGAEETTLSAPFAFSGDGSAWQAGIHTTLSFNAEDPVEASRAMQDIVDEDMSGSTWSNSYVYNNAESARNAVLIVETIQLFINCFIAITCAIAVANVFNTITNSIILRRREFATLKSIGLGGRAFARMILLECASYAWRGLVFGLVLGAGVTLLVWMAINQSISFVSYGVPVIWVIAAVGVVVGVLALSTVYALRRSRADSIVQTLRQDSI